MIISQERGHIFSYAALKTLRRVRRTDILGMKTSNIKTRL